ncbi:MAG: hypothetical protein ACRDZR_05335 [Acidimicrobiales bacterium]
MVVLVEVVVVVVLGAAVLLVAATAWVVVGDTDAVCEHAGRASASTARTATSLSRDKTTVAHLPMSTTPVASLALRLGGRGSDFSAGVGGVPVRVEPEEVLFVGGYDDLARDDFE